MLRAWFARVIIYFIGDDIQMWLSVGQRQQQVQLRETIMALQQQITRELIVATTELRHATQQHMTTEVAQHRTQTIDHVGKVVQQLLLVMRQLNNYTTVRAITHQEALLRATEECMATLSAPVEPRCHH